MLQAARRWEHHHEKIHRTKLQKFLNINPAKIAWCAYFINALLKERGFKGTQSGSARSFLNIGEEINLLIAKPGDIVILKRGRLPWQGHVGLFVRQIKDKVILLGGNQSDMVKEKAYPVDKVIGVRRYGN